MEPTSRVTPKALGWTHSKLENSRISFECLEASNRGGLNAQLAPSHSLAQLLRPVGPASVAGESSCWFSRNRENGRVRPNPCWLGANKIESLSLSPCSCHAASMRGFASLAQTPFPYKYQLLATSLSFADSKQVAALTGRLNRVSFF